VVHVVGVVGEVDVDKLPVNRVKIFPIWFC
jgi:hypothetical protein